jgi:DNA-binding MarR family transcriptional regulator
MSDTPLRAELINEVVTGFGDTGRLLKQYMHDGNASHELGPSQMHLLFCIATWQPAPTQKVLAQYMHVTPGGLTQLIEPLVEAGYVIRQASDSDRRILHVTLSTAGKRKIRELKASRSQLFATLLESLSDSDLQALLKAQKKIYQALTTQEQIDKEA